VKAKLEGVRVLLVEDYEDSRHLMTAMLVPSGMRVTAVGTAAEALATLQREPFDILLADIGLPDQNGYDLLQTIRRLSQECRSIPAVAVTAFVSREDQERAAEAGFQAHVGKPIERSVLLSSIHKVL